MSMLLAVSCAGHHAVVTMQTCPGHTRSLHPSYHLGLSAAGCNSATTSLTPECLHMQVLQQFLNAVGGGNGEHLSCCQASLYPETFSS